MKVKKYKDENGWKYRAMPDLSGGNPNFKVMCQKHERPGHLGWEGVSGAQWWPSFDEAQADLDLFAMEKGWTECLN